MTPEMMKPRSLYAYTIALILVWLVVLQLHLAAAETATTESPSALSTSSAPATSSPNANPLTEAKHELNCKALCEHCGCLGFYCGEECLCECNDENSDTECIRTMQENAKTLNTPFQILIQGPSSNRFVRNAQQFEQRRDLVVRSGTGPKTARNRRNTITIYKPSKSAGKHAASQLTANALEAATKGAKESELVRHKRSVDNLEWFNDFAGSLVRPSPLGTRGQKPRVSKPAAFKRQAAPVEPAAVTRREPWFFEQSGTPLIRPAPLKKRQQANRDSKRAWKSRKTASSKAASSEESQRESERDIRPLRDAMQVVERIPRVLQDTVSHLSSDNKNREDVFSLNIMNDDVEPKERAPVYRRPSGRSMSRFRNDISPEAVTLAPAVGLPTLAPLLPQRGGLLFPWLRQQRLRRLQQARGNQ
ncbi:uncharacterized protein LOC117580309 [Drosophila guanche]|uniref:Uncharacterized protein n=1 Tax=Drosophila guanche TaxID=7266 RepID=A0A3B0K2A4_DROGU|nr:uncharacterized protein LOC117580309 [Drosophila guanche]SPP77518.1 Hypothetical predicted protein [Drosophila guanche]